MQVQVHTADVEGLSENLSFKRFPRDPPFFVNYYSVQSKDFFLKNNETRGDSNGFYKVSDRDLAWFNTCDINDIEDTRLARQNEKYMKPPPPPEVVTIW